MSGDSLTVTDVNMVLNFKPGEYRLYLSEKVYNPYSLQEYKSDPFQVIVAPNPVIGLCSIMVAYKGTASCKIKAYSISGAESEIVYNGQIDNGMILPWTPRHKGIQMLEIRIGNQQVIRKVIVQ
jgi:hypothetical protein